MKNLKSLRVSKKLTQSDVAKYLGVSRQCYNNYELGHREPDTKTLKQLATLFNTTVDFLIGHTDNQTEIIHFSDYEELKSLDENGYIGVIKEAMNDGISAEDLSDFVAFLKKRKK